MKGSKYNQRKRNWWGMRRDRERERIVKGIEKQGGPRKESIRREAERGEEPAGRAEGNKDISGFLRM